MILDHSSLPIKWKLISEGMKIRKETELYHKQSIETSARDLNLFYKKSTERVLKNMKESFLASSTSNEIMKKCQDFENAIKETHEYLESRIDLASKEAKSNPEKSVRWVNKLFSKLCPWNGMLCFKGQGKGLIKNTWHDLKVKFDVEDPCLDPEHKKLVERANLSMNMKKTKKKSIKNTE